MMTWMKIMNSLETPDGFEVAQAPPDESVFDVKKQDAVADAFPGCQILSNWPAVGWIEGEVMKPNV
jgi:hypothetical protein